MTNNSSFPLTTMDLNFEKKPTTIDHQSLIDEKDSMKSILRNYEQHPSSSYMTWSVGDHRNFGSSKYQDPLFYQQPLHLHYNQPISTTNELEHETGDRLRLINEIEFNKHPKQKSISTRKYSIEKSKSIHRRDTFAKKSKDKIIKAKEKKKKILKRNVKKGKKVNRTGIRRLRYQSKNRQAIVRKRHRQQQMLLKQKKKKKLLKKRLTSKKRLIGKINKKKSLTSNQHTQRSKKKTNRVISRISSRQSSISRLTRTPSITQSKRKNSAIFPSTERGKKLSKKNIVHSKSNSRKLSTPKSKQIKQKNRQRTKLNVRSSVRRTFKQNVRRYQKRRSSRVKTKYPRCTSKTLITLARMCNNAENMKKSVDDTQNDNMCMNTSSPSVFSLKNNVINQQSSTSTIMPLAKNTAQLTSKNNNECMPKIKRRSNRNFISPISGRNLIEPSGKGMALRSRTIIINDNNNSMKEKGAKYK